MTKVLSFHDISLNDRAFNYGDGFFTTVAVINHTPQLFQRHLERIQVNAESLGIDITEPKVFLEQAVFDRFSSDFVSPFDGVESALKLVVEKLCQNHQQACFVIKILVSRGNGGRGYAPDLNNCAQLFISTHDYPEHYKQLQSDGICVEVAELRLAHQPRLAGLKHLNRLEQVLVKQELAQRVCDDLIVLDQDGYVVEATAANLFWLNQQNQWCTPSLEKCGIAGVYREHILETMSNQGMLVMVCNSKIDAVLNAKSVFVCNSLMQIVPVTRLRLDDKERHYSVKEAQGVNKLLQEEAKK